MLIYIDGVYQIWDNLTPKVLYLSDSQIFKVDNLAFSLQELRSGIQLWEKFKVNGVDLWRLSVKVLIEPEDLPAALV